MDETKDKLQHAMVCLIRAYLEECDDDGMKSSTAELAERLLLAGEEHGCMTWGDHVKGRPEYLVDYCWSRKAETDGEWRGYSGLVLAAEFEWGGTVDALWEDFIKLADINADGRLFIASLTRSAWSRFRDADKGQLHADVVDFWADHRFLRPGDWAVILLMPKGKAKGVEPELHVLTREVEGASSRSLPV